MKTVVGLTSKTLTVLEETMDREHLTKMYTINRSIRLYGYLTKEISKGSTLIIRDSDDNERIFLMK